MTNLLSVEELKTTVLPALFASTGDLSSYGAASSGADSLTKISDLMESGAVSALAAKIQEIVAKLADADPRRIAKPATWFERITGMQVERRVRYEFARRDLDDLLSESEVHAQRVRDTVHALDQMIQGHAVETSNLKAYIQAGREYLDENPEAGAIQSGAVEFERTRDRFARKLANLATLLTSLEMSAAQMKLARAQAVDMLDRFSETATILVPIWRRHTLALIQTKHMSPAMVAEAANAHQALIRSLTKSLDGMEQ
ncbi:toxic anion resistance protein [Burkholderia gladioli]|uniref:toxic anion resistance protein n=1 Tax=Burkholderia gladioli TaxID=28095 RepID=UPI0028613B8F|nr:toxic anion resistance protein [Burkholderia gladioli]MDR8092959.1 toxic anion resistance protein [Burkholderia gladioli]